MKKGGKVSAAPPTDLLVCFPSRAQLALMPKTISSPSRPNDTSKRHNHLKKLSGLGNTAQAASPLLWTRPTPVTTHHQSTSGGHDHHHHEEMSSEPNSPKVTCAGQIKVRPRVNCGGGGAANCRSWQSVMEEIERIHSSGNGKKREVGSGGSKKRSHWGKDAMQFLTCLRNLRFDFRCFGSFSGQDILSSDEEEDEEDDDDDGGDGKVVGNGDNKDVEEEEEEESSRAVFSKWFMVLQENHENEKEIKCDDDDDDEQSVIVPPKNALLLMRCRSAPAMSRLEEKQKEELQQLQFQLQMQKSEPSKEEEQQDDHDEEEDEKVEMKRKRETLAMVMRYDTNFYKLSSDIAKETWLVDGLKSMDASVLSSSARCNSWKR